MMSIVLKPGFELLQEFTTIGSHSFEKPNGVNSVNVLIIGGGGSGGCTKNWGSTDAGGGGAGGYRLIKNYDISGYNETIEVFVGAGGAEKTVHGAGNNGQASSFGSLEAAGGGGGGGDAVAKNGGSGGGGTGGAGVNNSGGLGNVPSVSPSQGNDGGGGRGVSGGTPGGGGGAGSAGVAGISGGAGGSGITPDFIENAIEYCKGGNRGRDSYVGEANTGNGGGGGGRNANGRAGGSGTVIVYRGPIYLTEGYYVSQPITISELVEQRINWAAEVPVGTSVVVETAITEAVTLNGEIWAEQTNGQPISNWPEDPSGKYLWLKVTLSTEDDTVTPSVSALWLEEATPDPNKIQINLTYDGRMKYPQGDISIEFSGSLVGPGGSYVEPFIETFTPVGITPIFNPNAPDHLAIFSPDITMAVKEVFYESYKLDEPADQICIYPPSMALTITHVGTLPL